MRVSSWKKSEGDQPRFTATATNGEHVEVVKRSGSWRLLVDGVEHANLGRRASFDHAEGALLGIEGGR